MNAREHHYRTTITWSGAAQGPARAYASYSREFALEHEPVVTATQSFAQAEREH